MDTLSYYVIVATAGHDTTASAMAGGFHALIENPEQLARLQADPSLIPTAVDEIIRWVTPVKHFMRNGVGVPGFAVFMMSIMGVIRKLSVVAPTLAYDTRLVTPFWTNTLPSPDTWANVTMPVLDIGGGKSEPWMQNAQVAVSQALPNATHKTLPGQNHMVAPTAIAPMIREFAAA